MAVTTVAPVETHGRSGQEPAHYRGDRQIAYPQQQMQVICHDCPGKAQSFTIGQDIVKLVEKIIIVRVIENNLSSIYPSYNDVVQRSRGVYSGFSRPVNPLFECSEFINRKYEERPLKSTKSNPLSLQK